MIDESKSLELLTKITNGETDVELPSLAVCFRQISAIAERISRLKKQEPDSPEVIFKNEYPNCRITILKNESSDLTVKDYGGCGGYIDGIAFVAPGERIDHKKELTSKNATPQDKITLLQLFGALHEVYEKSVAYLNKEKQTNKKERECGKVMPKLQSPNNENFEFVYETKLGARAVLDTLAYMYTTRKMQTTQGTLATLRETKEVVLVSKVNNENVCKKVSPDSAILLLSRSIQENYAQYQHDSRTKTYVPTEESMNQASDFLNRSGIMDKIVNYTAGMLSDSSVEETLHQLQTCAKKEVHVRALFSVLEDELIHDIETNSRWEPRSFPAPYDKEKPSLFGNKDKDIYGKPIPEKSKKHFPFG